MGNLTRPVYRHPPNTRMPSLHTHTTCRLDALTQQHQQSNSRSAAAQGHQPHNRQQPQQRGKRSAGDKTPAAAPTPAQAATAEGQPTSGDQPEFPYQPLASTLSANSQGIAARLQLPGPTRCKGNLEDALEALMVPHMPLPIAQSMIASRTAADKAVVLVNPTGRVNLARPSASSKGQRQLLAGKLLPRAKRAQLSALPHSGIDYGPMLALHDLWCKYVSGVLSNATADNFERVLRTVDWHGALLRVVGSSNPIYLHRVGVAAKVTLNTFVLVSDDGRRSVIPLKGSTFECSVDCSGRLVHLVLSGDTSKSLKCVEKSV